MDGIRYAVFTDKSIRLLGKNQYTSNVESGSTRTEIKHWVELFFGVKVIAMNSHRLRGKARRMGPIMGQTRCQFLQFMFGILTRVSMIRSEDILHTYCDI